jgi:hypothetical protein
MSDSLYVSLNSMLDSGLAIFEIYAIFKLLFLFSKANLIRQKELSSQKEVSNAEIVTNAAGYVLLMHIINGIYKKKGK